MPIMFKPYQPAFVDTKNRPQWEEFADQASLLNALHRFVDSDFCWFAISGRDTIMAVYDGGKRWYVAGFVQSDDGLDLREWKHSSLT